MSSGPTLIGETAITAIKKGWFNVEVTKEMYCSYKGECPIHRVIQGEETCLWCKYRVSIDMPLFIKEKWKNGKV